MSLLAKLLALASRPGTEAEGAAARAHAERIARREGLELVDVGGKTLAVDEFRADLLRRLEQIAGDRPVRRLGR